jgi:hypothetical protein
MGNSCRCTSKLADAEKENAMFSAIHWDGSSDKPTTRESLSDLFDELRIADQEHGDVAVVHEDSGWTISVHRDGRVVLENLSDGGERHMIPVSKERVLQLWELLIKGDVDALLREPWELGYGK